MILLMYFRWVFAKAIVMETQVKRCSASVLSLDFASFTLTNVPTVICTHKDCAEGLVCHQREEYDPVPSCVGRGERTNDYCIYPSDETAKPPVSGSFRMKLYWEPGVEW